MNVIMKKLLRILTVLCLAVLTSSCLTHGLKDLKEFSGADITGLQGCYWRYYGTNVNPGSGEKEVLQVRIASGIWTVTNETENSADATFVIQFSDSFPMSERSTFSTKNMVVVFNISQAAVIKPIEGSATLGVPGDWSKPNKYEVRAADGTKKIWTVSLAEIRNGHIVGL